MVVTGECVYVGLLVQITISNEMVVTGERDDLWLVVSGGTSISRW